MFVFDGSPNAKISYNDMSVSNMLPRLWMRTALRFVVECVRNLEARVPQLVFSVTVPEHMFWDMLPAPVLTDRQYRRLSFTTDECCEKEEDLRLFIPS